MPTEQSATNKFDRHFGSFPVDLIRKLPVVFWVTDIQLRIRDSVSGIKNLPSHSAAIQKCEDGWFVDVRYSQHPDVIAHIRARAGEAVTWRTGEIGNLQACALPLREKGAVIGVAGAAVELPQSRPEEIRRRTVEQMLELLCSRGGLSVSMTDEGGRVIFANEDYCAALGLPLERVLGREEGPLLKGRQGKEIEKSYQHALEGGVFDWRAQNGKNYRSALFTMSSPTGVNVTYNIARESLSQEPLREHVDKAERLSTQLFLKSPEPMALTDEKGILEEVNHEFCRLLRVDTEKIQGESIERWLDGNVTKIREIYSALVASGNDVESREEILLRTAEEKFVLAEIRIRRLRERVGRAAVVLRISRWRDPGDRVLEGGRGGKLNIDKLDRGILEILASGESNASISEVLMISRQGLDYRLKRLREAFKVESRGALVARAYFLGIFDRKDWPPRVREL
ncbi:PAS domain-containing protein [Streptomyces sp. NPDC096198]|uniref:PAS domain-containing protein n=1 Tax=Streptomyces sp. NPDC096198 TaxID=3366080 RepID=UPI00381A45B1